MTRLLTRAARPGTAPAPRLETRRITVSLLALSSFVGFALAAWLAPDAIALIAGFVAVAYGIGSASDVFGPARRVNLGAAGAVGIGFSVVMLGSVVMITAGAWYPAAYLGLLIAASSTAHLCVLVPAARTGELSVVLRGHAARVNLGGAAGAPELVGAVSVVATGYALVRAHDMHLHGDIPIGGLLTVIGTTWYFALAVIVVAIAYFAWRRKPAWLLFSGLQLVVVVFASPALAYHVPRSQSAEKHIDIVRVIMDQHSMGNTIAIYKAWPGFFTGVAAAMQGLGDRTGALQLTVYWPLLMALASFAVVASLCWVLHCDLVTCYLVATIACLANVLQQDYFSPQSVGFILALTVFTVCVVTTRPVQAPADALVPAKRHPGFQIEWWQVGYSFVISGAIAVSHQFTPFAVAGAVGLLLVWGVLRPLKRSIALTAVVGVVPALWALAHLSPIREFLSPDQIGNASNFATPTTFGDARVARLPIVSQSSLALLFTLLVIGIIAVVGGLPRLRSRTTWAIGSAALFAFSLIVITPYGNEGIFRASLFALPWLMILGIPVYRALANGGWIKVSILAVILAVITGQYVVAVGGLDASNVARPADVDVYRYVSAQAEQHPNTVYAVIQIGPGDMPTNLPVAPKNVNYLRSNSAPSSALPTELAAQRYLHTSFSATYGFMLDLGHIVPGQRLVEYVFYSPAAVAYAREYGWASYHDLLNIRAALYQDPEMDIVWVRDRTVLARVHDGVPLREYQDERALQHKRNG